MARGSYIGVSGKARKVKKMYIGVNDKAKKVKKVYIGDSNNKARLCWSSGNTWKKYSCEITTTWTMYPSNINWGEWSYEREIDSTCGSYSSWEFSESWGFSGVGYRGGKYIDNVGYLMVESDRVTIIQSVVDNGDGTITVTRKPIEVAYSTTHYSKGSTSYGKVEADSDALPEQGTLLSGSIEGRHCVINVNNNTYYYEKVV